VESRVKRKLRVLDFDLENRPLSYAGYDWTSAEVTAIAASWVGQKKVHCWALGEVDGETMLRGFRALYDQADIVTGHYIRMHDLPMLSGAFLEHGLEPMKPVLTSDTMKDLVRRKDLSASQEALSEMYGLPDAKHHMTQPAWREANRLTAEGIRLTKKRVIDDVIQHKGLRERLIKQGVLKPPRIWKP